MNQRSEEHSPTTNEDNLAYNLGLVRSLRIEGLLQAEKSLIISEAEKRLGTLPNNNIGNLSQYLGSNQVAGNNNNVSGNCFNFFICDADTMQKIIADIYKHFGQTGIDRLVDALAAYLENKATNQDN